MQGNLVTLCWEGIEVVGILLGAYVVESTVHEIAHFGTALAVGVRPTALCLFTSPSAPRGRLVSVEWKGHRVEIGTHPLRYFVCFDDQHPVWKMPPAAAESLARAGCLQVAAIALAGPLVHVLTAVLCEALVIFSFTGETTDWACRWVIVASVILAAANLLPVGSSDGAHALNALRRRPPHYGRKLVPWEEWTLASVACLTAAIAWYCLF